MKWFKKHKNTPQRGCTKFNSIKMCINRIQLWHRRTSKIHLNETIGSLAHRLIFLVGLENEFFTIVSSTSNEKHFHNWNHLEFWKQTSRPTSPNWKKSRRKFAQNSNVYRIHNLICKLQRGFVISRHSLRFERNANLNRRILFAIVTT